MRCCVPTSGIALRFPSSRRYLWSCTSGALEKMAASPDQRQWFWTPKPTSRVERNRLQGD